MSEAVKVVVRCRPFNSREKENASDRCITIDQETNQVIMREVDGNPMRNFAYDAVYDSESRQTDVYEQTAKPIVNSCFDGYNGTVFCYGQTGAGKTFTMEGKEEPKELRGIVYNTFYHIFDNIAQQPEGVQTMVTVSFLEIYNEELRDLIGPKGQKLELKESKEKGLHVKGLSQVCIQEANKIDSLLQTGKKNRTVGATLMNAESSRSHSIFMISIETSETNTATGEKMFRVGKLNLVDLAGSERADKTGATGDRLQEGCKINMSLSALGNVISALVEGKGKHVPYRNSKLTRLLQDSLGGNTKTVMVANISPADFNYDETYSTLRYASRAKKIQNKPIVNEDPKDALLKKYLDTITQLENRLKGIGIDDAINGGVTNIPTIQQPVAGVQQEFTSPGTPTANTVVQQTIISTVNEEKLHEMMKKKEEEKQQLLEDMRSKSHESEEKLKQIIQQQTEEKERLMEEIKQKSAEEEKELRRQFSEKQSAAEEERQRVEEEVKTYHEKLQKHMEEAEVERRRKDQLMKEKEEITKRLEEMQAQVIQGKNYEKLEETSKRQQEKMRRQKEELQRRREHEVQYKKELQDAQDEKLELEQQYASAQEEAEVKTKKLKKLWSKYQSSKSEIQDMHTEIQREREDYLYTIRQLERELKLKCKIIDNFIPSEEQSKITTRSTWDEDLDDWKIQSIAAAGNNIKMARPQSSFAGAKNSVRSASSLGNGLRSSTKVDNILNLELEMPERTTQDFGQEKQTSPTMQSSKTYFTYNASNGNGNNNNTQKKKVTRPPSGKRPKTASKEKPLINTAITASDSQQQVYPTSRGLKSSQRFT
ncbi:kinesin-like protein [Acrasis kona]|uniref:Kinesin-like protein n=1 Tax=Acrasis kona TaxID=1008807 RepID=A0AAW2ZDV8_9EUKA